ncbi:TPA: DUF551 domain-containing protein [Klebsiella aerogenes]|nr:DUF551 domain-containing protein [Klebsiella aerogenes]
MDSEPVGEFYEDGPLNWYQISDGDRVPAHRRIPLYRHAQPALVVQCPFPCGWDNLNKLAIQDAALVARGLVEGEPTTEAHRQAAISNNDRLLKVISACREAEPVTTANKLPPNSFTDDELEGMAHGNNPQSNAYRELLAYRRNSPVIPDTWIPVSERLPEEGGRYWCYVEEQNSLGKSHYQWNCSWNGEIWGGAMMYGRVTHWMPLPAAPQEVKP